ncbi:MAG: FAD-linked oxidase C-terminal domain-containing protein, partial [Burkholderiaceae bacterium]
LKIGTSASTPVQIAVSIVMGVGAVYFWIHRKAKKRMDLVEEQLPDAVELMARIKRAFDPLNILNPGKVVRLS